MQDSLGAQIGPQLGPNIAQKADLDPVEPLRAAKGCLQGAILELFWSGFGPAVVRLWNHGGTHSGVIVAPASSPFRNSRYLLACHYCYHGVSDS